MNNKKNNKLLYIVIILVIIFALLLVYFITNKENNTKQEQNNNQEQAQMQEEVNIYDENAIKEIKTNIENLEVEYIKDNSKAKSYTENTFLEISKINKDNYKKYFQSEEEYGKYISEVFLKVCEHSYDLVQDFSKSKIDTKTFSNRFLPFLQQVNNFIDYMQDNPMIYFENTYDNVQSAKYDSLQKEISNSYIFFDMEFAQDVTDIINAYNKGKLPKNKTKYSKKAKRIAENILELKNNTANVTLNKFINNNYKGSVEKISNSILSNINTFSEYSNTYNTESGKAVSNLVENYGELLELVGGDLKF